MMTIDIRKYVIYLLKRSWIVVIVSLAFGAIAYRLLGEPNPLYIAEARIFVGGEALSLNNPDVRDIDFGQRLAPTYAQFAKDFDVLTATIEALNLNLSPTQLERKISTRIILDTAILQIRVEDTDPQRAASIANEIARNLILNSPSNLTEDEQLQLTIQTAQIAELEDQIAITREQSLETLQRLNDASDRRDQDEIDELTAQYNRLVDALNSSRATLAQLSDTFVGLSNRVNRLQIVDIARPPRGASSTNPLVFAILGVMAGGGLSVGGILLYFEYIDDKLRTENEIQRELELPVLGILSSAKRGRMQFDHYLVTDMAPMSRISEEFRSLQTKLLLHTNLLLSSENKGGGKVYMVVSPRHDEGRSFVIANLAVIAAEVGLKVLLIDADLRESAQHKIFEVNDEIGLVSMLMQAKETDSGKQDMQSYIQNTRIPNLDIMVSGIGDQTLSKQVVNFDKLQGCIENIQKNLDYDIILVDTSPSLLFSESYVIAATTKATTILLVEAGKTSLPDAQKARDQYNQMECVISGVVLNKG